MQNADWTVYSLGEITTGAQGPAHGYQEPLHNPDMIAVEGDTHITELTYEDIHGVEVAAEAAVERLIANDPR